MIYEPEWEARPPAWRRVALVAAATVAVVAVVLLMWRAVGGGDDASDSASGGDDTVETTSAPNSTEPDGTASGDLSSSASDSEATTGSTSPNESSPTSADAEGVETTASTSPGSTPPPTDTDADPVSDTPPDGTANNTNNTSTDTSEAPAQQFSYPASADGTPLPIVVVFDTDTITVTGQVPTQAAKDRLAGLAIANSQFPDAQLVDNMVINPDVPLSVGARVIELNSARFPEGSAEILPEHAVQLDRVANIMNLLPNVSVLVVGHADQRGDETRNFAISDERARAVVNYLRYLGVQSSRLTSRAAGESDLLSLADDDVSLALNRRTEFIFYGLLIE